MDSCSGRSGSASKIDDASVQFRFCAASLRVHGSARRHNNTHAYFVSGWEKEAEKDDHFRTAPTENSGPKFKFRLLRSLVKLITFQNFKPKRVNKSGMLQNFSQTQGAVFYSSACISSSEGFFKNRSAHFCGKSPSSGACPSQIAILLSLGLKFLMKWKPTYIYGDLNFSDSQQVFANLFSWRKLEGSLIISWKFQGRTPQEIWITAIFPARSKVVSYDVLHHMFWKILMVTKWSWAAIKSSTMTLMRARWPNSWLAKILFLTASAFFCQAGPPWGYCKVTNFRTVFIFVHFVLLKKYEI